LRKYLPKFLILVLGVSDLRLQNRFYQLDLELVDKLLKIDRGGVRTLTQDIATGFQVVIAAVLILAHFKVNLLGNLIGLVLGGKHALIRRISLLHDLVQEGAVRDDVTH
jgi:hypothetical protein